MWRVDHRRQDIAAPDHIVSFIARDEFWLDAYASAFHAGCVFSDQFDQFFVHLIFVGLNDQILEIVGNILHRVSYFEELRICLISTARSSAADAPKGVSANRYRQLSNERG